MESPKKRKVGKEDRKPSKRARKNFGIKRYITCKKWRLEEKEREEGQTEQEEKEPTLEREETTMKQKTSQDKTTT